jgi:hypothetical protein
VVLYCILKGGLVVSGRQRLSAVVSGRQRSSAVVSGCQRSSAVVSGCQRSSAVSGRLCYFWICTIKNASNVYINLYSYTLNFHTNSIQNCYYYGRSGIYDSSQCASSLLSGP